MPQRDHAERAGLRVFHRATQVARKTVAVEDVAPQDQRAGLSGDELLADEEGPHQPVRRWLLHVGEADPELQAIPEQSLEVGQVRGIEIIRMSRMPAIMSTDIG